MTFCIGESRGLRISQFIGSRVSIGIHIHVWPPKEAHVDLHLGWWLVTIGHHGGC